MKKESIPKNWIHCMLADFCDLIMGQSPPSTTYNTEKHGLPFYQGKSEFGDIFPTPVKYCSKPIKISEAGDIFMSVRAPVGPTNINPHKACIGRGLAAIRPLSDVSAKFLFFYFRNIEKDISKKGTGTTFKAITKASLENVSLFIPSLPEQNQIVSKIEELFSDLDSGVENLKKARAQLKTYRQAVLKYAFEGKLTEEWRKENKPGSADRLLKQIKVEREKLCKKQLEKWQKKCEKAKAEGKKKPTKPRQPKELPPLTKAELAEMPDLIAGWIYTVIQNFLSLEKKGLTTGPFGTALRKADHRKYGAPVFGIENIGKGVFIPGNKIFITREKANELKSFKVSGGDIIISRSGTVGEICAVPNGLGLSFLSTNLMRVSLNSNIIIPQYFVFLFQGGSIVKKQVEKLCKGSTRAFLNQTILKSIIFPLPNVEEQSIIVQEIESRLSVCDKLEQTIENSLKKAEALRQSILKKAFEGELTKEWRKRHPELVSGENSAEKLLERIQAERAKRTAGKKPTRAKKKRPAKGKKTKA